jgi:hypothetical protein
MMASTGGRMDSHVAAAVGSASWALAVILKVSRSKIVDIFFNLL